MSKLSFNELLDAGVHFGHLKRKWNPNMAPYIFMERNGIHIIDLNKTAEKLDVAAAALKQIAKSGRKILFVATKKQAKDIVSAQVKQVNMPYVTERWPGGMLTNFPTIRKAVKKMAAIDNMASDGTFDTLSKRERLQITRQRAKLEKNLGSISDLTRLPAALFVVDIAKEYIAVREARRLNIPVFAMVDTNSDPNLVEFPIPANDDAAKSISLIVDVICKAIEEGLAERKMEKDKEAVAEEAAKAEKEGVKEEAAGEPAGKKVDKVPVGEAASEADVNAEVTDEDETGEVENAAEAEVKAEVTDEAETKEVESREGSEETK
jgi:small subunit ribosomal protein S2